MHRMASANVTRERDVRAFAEALADVLAERGLVIPAASAIPARVVDAAEVARLLGRDRQWVYDHAAELGAFRYGDGPRARIGFDLAAVERWKRERQISAADTPPPRPRRRPAGGGSSKPKLIPYETPPARP